MWGVTLHIKSEEVELGACFRNKYSKMLHKVNAANFMLKKEALFSSPAVAVLVGSTFLLERSPGCSLNSLSSLKFEPWAVINEREVL